MRGNLLLVFQNDMDDESRDDLITLCLLNIIFVEDDQQNAMMLYL